MRLLNSGGVLLSDNILYHGMIEDEDKVERRKITIVKRLHMYLEEIMNNHPVDYKGLINNIKMANDLRANKRAARLNDNIQIITILFTVIGGLPSIRNILRIIKKVFFIKADLIPNLTLDQMAIFLWILVILAVVIRIYKGNKL